MAVFDGASATDLGLLSKGPSVSRRRLAGLSSFVRTQPMGAFSAAVLLLLVVAAVFAPLVTQYTPTENTKESLVGPSLRHWFGTDQFGRDIFSRVVYGARVSLYVGLGATVVGTIGSTVLGLVTAYRGGWLDYIVQRVVDAVQSIPPLVLLISVLVVLGPSTTNVVIALAVRAAITSSRVVRSVALGIMGSPYMESARVIGCSHTRSLLVYLLPNVMPTVIVLASVAIGANILAEATLSFLGYGVPPPSPTWGGMMSSEGRLYMFVAPWILIAPTVALSLVVFAMNMFGDSLRDVLDPRMRGSR